MPLNVMLHDSVIPVGVNANIRFMGEAVIHYIAEDTMYVRIAGDTMNHMIRPSTMPSRVGIAINFIIFSQILLIQRAKVLIIPHFFVYLQPYFG